MDDPAFITQLVKIIVAPERVGPLPGYDKKTKSELLDEVIQDEKTSTVAQTTDEGDPKRDSPEPRPSENNATPSLLDLLRTKDRDQIETICTNISALPRKLSTAILREFFARDTLKQFFEEAPQVVDEDENKKISYAMLLSLPFAIHSPMMKNLAKSYAKSESLCPALTTALVYRKEPDPGQQATTPHKKALKLKKFVLCTLCHVIEAEHILDIAAPVPDRYRLVYPCLQIIQCPKATSLLKQFATRILLMELENGIRARQNLMDYFTISIISDLIPSNCKPPPEWPGKNGGRGVKPGVCYDDSQWLIIYLLRFLYRAFDFEHLWEAPEFKRDGHLVAVDFDESLSLRCANLVSHAATLEVRAAAKLILTYPINWQNARPDNRNRTRTASGTARGRARKITPKKRNRPLWKTAFPAMVKEMHTLQNQRDWSIQRENKKKASAAKRGH